MILLQRIDGTSDPRTRVHGAFPSIPIRDNRKLFRGGVFQSGKFDGNAPRLPKF